MLDRAKCWTRREVSIFATRPSESLLLSELLTEGERKGLDTWIEEFNLKSCVLDRSVLPDELIHPGLPNLACAVSGGIGTMIGVGRDAVQFDFEANRRPVPGRT